MGKIVIVIGQPDFDEQRKGEKKEKSDQAKTDFLREGKGGAWF